MNSSIEVVPSAPKAPPGGNPVLYTADSVKHLVVCVAHMLDHFADKTHQGLKEPQNKARIMHDTGVLVFPNAGKHINLVGYQLFVSNPAEQIAQGGQSSIVAVIFDLRAYENMGDRYLFNMLKKLTESIRESHRPSDERLRELSTQYALSH